MPRLKSVVSGVTISVSDETAALLGSEWGSATKSDTPDKSWKIDDLKAYAAEKSIDLGPATRKEDILVAISAAAPAGDGDGSEQQN